MKKYLYLAKPWMADTWIKGGVVPLSVASTYASDRRSGTLTPDENQQNDYNTGPRGYIDIRGGMRLKDITIFDAPGLSNGSGRGYPVGQTLPAMHPRQLPICHRIAGRR